MHFPHSITIDGETYIHKERYEREMVKKDAEATNLCDLLRYTREQGERFRTERNDALDEQDRLKGLLDEAQALLADGGVSHAAHEAALAEKDRQMAERDVEYRKLERDWQHLGKRVLELQDEIAALRAGRTPYGQLHAELEQAKTALAEKDAEIAALQQRLHDAIETREGVIRRLDKERDEARSDWEGLQRERAQMVEALRQGGKRLATLIDFIEADYEMDFQWLGETFNLTPR